MNAASVATWRDEIARQRADIADDLFPTLPEHVLQIESCEVAYTFQPRVFPYRNVAFPDLKDLMAEEYSLHFKVPDISDLAAGNLLGNLSVDEIGQFLLSRDDPQLLFEDGLLKVPDNRAVSIHSVRLGDEHAFVKVYGPTRAGEQLVYELVPMLWALAGVRKTWATDIAPLHQLVQYGTGTRVRLANAALPLLHPDFTTLLKEWATPDGLAANMGGRDALHNWIPPANSTVTFSLDELHIVFDRTSPTGFSEATRLRIGVGARHERGSGVVIVGSELPFSEHLELLSSLLRLGRT